MMANGIDWNIPRGDGLNPGAMTLVFPHSLYGIKPANVDFRGICIAEWDYLYISIICLTATSQS